LAAAVAIAVYLLAAAWASAAAGDLDASFGTSGRFTQNFQIDTGVSSTDSAQDVVVRPDGQILIGGSTFVFDPPTLKDIEWVVLGLPPTGVPGPGGAVFSFADDPEHGANGLALQPDGKLLLAGTTGSMGSNVVIDRLTTTGGYDSGFGTPGGHPVFDFAGSDGAGVGTDGAGDLVRQPDGSIVTAGYSDNQFGLVRVTSAGVLDNSFDGNGRKRVDFTGTVDGATSVALSGSKIIAAGYTDSRFAILSLNSNGSVDSSFGVGTGRTESGVNELPQGANAVAVQSDGKILVAGPGNGNFGVGRVKTDGFYDPSFGPNGNGQVAIDFGGNDVATAMTLQPDGKILVAGTDGDGFAVARLMPNGALDPSFGTGGKATVNFTGVDIAHGMALQPDGKIVLVGETGPAGGTTDYAVTRLLGDPAPVATPPVVAPKKKCKKKKHRATSAKKHKSCKKKRP
jgi:uncharacterized delta-60 repeat protein